MKEKERVIKRGNWGQTGVYREENVRACRNVESRKILLLQPPVEAIFKCASVQDHLYRKIMATKA